MTMVESWLPLLVILTSALVAPMIFALAEEQHGLRSWLNIIAAVLKIALVVQLTGMVMSGLEPVTRLPFLPGVDLVFQADALSVLFAMLSSLLWLVTTLYAIGYLENGANRSRFFGCFALCVSATMGVALAGNLLTFLIAYELLTLATYPLVVHRGDQASLKAGRTYLAYTLGGGALVLTGTAWLYARLGEVPFIIGGSLPADPALISDLEVTLIAGLLLAGLGVKAALVPLHGWLPIAMVAPAPVSALLHAVAVVKAGAFGIVRIVYDVIGIERAQSLGITSALLALAAVTIVWGSIRALKQVDLKRRLAYSTVSQVSYIALGAAIAHPIAAVGGIIHLVHQGVMKITLFFCAGALKETLGISRVDQLAGTGRRMPLTMAAFTIGALGMLGVPPTVGFLSKWYLASGALGDGMAWLIGLLVLSSVLNALYFLPLIKAAWFEPAPAVWPAEAPRAGPETALLLLIPPLVTAGMVLAMALFAASPYSPLGWSEALALREFGFAP